MSPIFKKFLLIPIFFTALICSAAYSDFHSAFKFGARLTRLSDGTAVGNFSGKFSVDPSGNAVYDIALKLPPGTAKMAPALSLHYDSSASNGTLGMGFSLQGLTAITRVNSNYAQNGGIHGVDFSNQDRFALNGQQLVSIGGTYGADGTEYRTYIDSQARIISQGAQGNGPAGFVVQTKGGQTAWYGTTQDSQILAQGTSSVAVWALAKIQDAAGNYISYHYTQDAANGMYYPSEIDYTSNDAAKLSANNSIKFSYEDRPDPITNYTSGSLFKTTKRLNEIQTYQGSNLVTDYKLSYEVSPNTFRSRVISIQECDGNGLCLRPLQFTWQTNEKGWAEAPQWKPPVAFTKVMSSKPADAGVRLTDIYGIGRPELLFASNDKRGNFMANTPAQSGAWKATDQGWAPDAVATPPVPIMSEFAGGGVNLADTMIPSGSEFADISGRGQEDLVQFFYGQLGASDGAYQYQANVFHQQNGVWNPQPSPWTDATSVAHLGGGTWTNQAFSGHLGEGGRLMDLLGDGRLSLVYGGLREITWGKVMPSQTMKYDPSGWIPLVSYNSPTPFVDGLFLMDDGAQVVYLTNSGLPDLMVANDFIQKTWINSGQLSNTPGASWVVAPNFSPPTGFRFMNNSQDPSWPLYYFDAGGRVTALIGSGLSDLLMAQSGTHQAWVNTGAGWITAPSGLVPPTDIVHKVNGDTYEDGVELVDVNGSGLPAWLQCSAADNNGKCQAWLNQNGAWVPDNDPADQNYAPPVPITDAKGQDNGVRFVDLLGTGFQDILINNGTQSDAWLNKAQTKPDVMTNVQDALGDHLQIQYKPITDSSVYTKGSSASYPNMDIQAPIYVVSQTSSDTDITPITIPAIAKKVAAVKLYDPSATQHITTYKYANAEFNHLGWGFLGFGSVTTKDQFTGISTTVSYSQDTNSKTQGMPTGTVTTKSDGTVVNKQTSTFTTKTFGDPTPSVNASWFFPYVTQTVETDYDYNTGAQIATKTTNTTMDNEGNPADISEVDVDSTGTYTTETQNTYVNHPDATWRLGELTQALVTATSVPPSGHKKVEKDSGEGLSRTSAFVYDDHGFLRSSTIEPDSTTNQLTKTYQRDIFGNVIETDVAGANIAARSEKLAYDPTGSFVVSKTKAMNETTKYQVDPKFGVVTQTTDPNGLVETNVLDSFGRVIQTNHPNGTQTHFQYEWSVGNDPAAPQGSVYEITQTETNASGQSIGPEKISYHDELDREIAQAMQGFVGNSTAAAPWIWQLTEYDQLGRVLGKTLPFFANTPSDDIYILSNQYDDLGRVVVTTNADGSTVNQAYKGYATTTTNPKGQSTTRIKNIRGNLVQAIDPEGHVTSYQYDAFDHLTQLTDSKGNVSTMQYDNLGHKLTMHDVDRGHSAYTYDALGELLSQTDANGNTTSFHYDLLGRVIERTDAANTPNAVTSSWQYGEDPTQHNVGKLISVNGVSHLSEDVNLKESPLPLWERSRVARVRGSFNQKKSTPSSVDILNAAKNNLVNYSRTFQYDTFARPANNTISLQNQNYTTSTTYDDNGRIDTLTYPNKVSIKNHYDPFGYLWQVTDNTSGITYSTVNAEDARGQVISTTHSNGLITNYTYDAKTNVLRDIQTAANNSVKMAQQFLPSGSPVAQNWKLAINSKKSSDPNVDDSGVAKIHSLFQSSDSLSANAPVQTLHYDYDLLGNVETKTDGVLNVQDNYQYDDLNRLTQDQTVDQTHGQTTSLNYAYDELGNITNKSDVGAYSYGANGAGPHAVTSVSGSGANQENDTFQYDANGNQTQEIQKRLDGSGEMITRNIAYTSFDLPQTITQVSNKKNKPATVSFYYDADHKRFMRQDELKGDLGFTTKTTTLYLDGMQIETTVGYLGKVTNQYKNYIGDVELITDDQGKTQRYDILKDNIGSTNAITDQNGNVVQRFHYDPFGEQELIGVAAPSDHSVAWIKRSENPGKITVATTHSGFLPKGSIQAKDLPRDGITKYGFTGQEEVATGGIDLIHMNGRMYDPHLGRFLSADPIIQDPSNSQSLNRYSYCLNDPLSLTDPSGFSWWSHFWHDVGHLFDEAAHSVTNFFRNETVDEILMLAVSSWATAGAGAFLSSSMFTHFAAAAAFNGVISYAQTGNVGFSFRTAGIELLSEYAWATTGLELGGFKNEVEHPIEASLVHGVVGGSLSLVEGDSFKNGFLSAAVSQLVAGPIEDIKVEGSNWATIMARGFASGVVGGTVEAEDGGNFENGMITSEAGELFNDEGVGDRIKDFFDSSTWDDVQNTANALGPEVGGPAKLGQEATEGLIAAADEAPEVIQDGGLLLQKSLASLDQMGQDGVAIGGGDSGVIFQDAPRVVAEWGGNTEDWAKMVSRSFVASDGFQFETHWVENLNTGQRVEQKTILNP